MFKYTFSREIDTLCQNIWHYLEGRSSELTLTEKDFILLQYTYTLYQDLTRHYYLGFKFMSATNRQDKKYLKYVLDMFSKYYELKESMLYY